MAVPWSRLSNIATYAQRTSYRNNVSHVRGERHHFVAGFPRVPSTPFDIRLAQTAIDHRQVYDAAFGKRCANPPATCRLLLPSHPHERCSNLIPRTEDIESAKHLLPLPIRRTAPIPGGHRQSNTRGNVGLFTASQPVDGRPTAENDPGKSPIPGEQADCRDKGSWEPWRVATGRLTSSHPVEA